MQDGQWETPELRLLLDSIVSGYVLIEESEIDATFPGISRRTMLLRAREVSDEEVGRRLIVLASRMSPRNAPPRGTAGLLQQKEILVREMQHRIANSLQDAHLHITSVAAVQRQLDGSRQARQSSSPPI